MRKYFLFLFFLFCSFSLMGQKLGPFCSFSVNSDSTIGPYINNIKYFCFFEKGNIPDNTFHNSYHFYFNVPDSIGEIGVRVLSPIPISISKKDQVDDNYFQHKYQLDYFDPIIILEKQVGKRWIQLDTNDNSEELPAQPSGFRNNSLIRVFDNGPGTYRVLVMSVGNEPIVGGCLLEIGTTDEIYEFRIYRKNYIE